MGGTVTMPAVDSSSVSTSIALGSSAVIRTSPSHSMGAVDDCRPALTASTTLVGAHGVHSIVDSPNSPATAEAVSSFLHASTL